MEREDCTKFDFLCEKRLNQTDKLLYQYFRNSIFALECLLSDYKNVFPFFTDHTFEHSEQVIRYCNIIAGEEIISALNADELYILLMGASLHDVGMGISEKDFRSFISEVPALSAYIEENPGFSVAEYTRAFHQELSACFIRKYGALFEIPSPEHLFAICALAHGHRKADLLNETEFPTDFLLPNGNRANLAYLAALVRLADEIDVTSDRNLLFDYSQMNENWSKKQNLCFQCHGAIKTLEVYNEALVLLYATDDAVVEQEIFRIRGKVERSFAVYRDVTEHRTPFYNRIKAVQFEKIVP